MSEHGGLLARVGVPDLAFGGVDDEKAALRIWVAWSVDVWIELQQEGDSDGSAVDVSFMRYEPPSRELMGALVENVKDFRRRVEEHLRQAPATLEQVNHWDLVNRDVWYDALRGLGPDYWSIDESDFKSYFNGAFLSEILMHYAHRVQWQFVKPRLTDCFDNLLPAVLGQIVLDYLERAYWNHITMLDCDDGTLRTDQDIQHKYRLQKRANAPDQQKHKKTRKRKQISGKKSN